NPPPGAINSITRRPQNVAQTGPDGHTGANDELPPRGLAGPGVPPRRLPRGGDERDRGVAALGVGGGPRVLPAPRPDMALGRGADDGSAAGERDPRHGAGRLRGRPLPPAVGRRRDRDRDVLGKPGDDPLLPEVPAGRDEVRPHREP